MGVYIDFECDLPHEFEQTIKFAYEQGRAIIGMK
jgi:hypothetical protein